MKSTRTLGWLLLYLAIFASVACTDKGWPYHFQRPEPSAEQQDEPRSLYLEMVKRSVTDTVYFGEPQADLRDLEEVESRRGVYHGSPRALSLLGHDSLDNIRLTMEDVLARGVEGDFIEAGAWRGGATIFMRAVLKAHGVSDRRVFVADSFEGFPEPDPDIKIDAGFKHAGVDLMIAPFDQVRRSFERFGLLDDQVVFLKGWFIDTLPTAPIEKLSVLRIDADMYESTMQALTYLYPKLSVGGYAIIDDYGFLESCRRAVDEYREANGIKEEIQGAGWGAVYWRRARASEP